MLVNTTYLKVELNSNDHFHIIVKAGEDMKHDFYLTREEWNFAETCIQGKAPFYPYFNDISYHAMLHPGGIRIVDVSNREYKDCYYTFPMMEVTKLLSTRAEYDADLFPVEFNESDCEQLKSMYAPAPDWNYRDIENTTWDKETCNFVYTTEYSLMASIEWYKAIGGLQEQLDRLYRIACSYSNGILGNATIYLSFDHRPSEHIPDSYYFYILDSDGDRVMNGGIIYHCHYEKYGGSILYDESGMAIGSYSMHT